MSWTSLKSAIKSVIKTNNNQEITGEILQNTLITIVNSVGANATFAGVAIPSTNPGTPDGPVFYLASQAGRYSNFGNVEIEQGKLYVFTWDGTVWSHAEILDVDNIITSTNGLVYDVSIKHPASGVDSGNTYTLSGALAVIPAADRKAGMSIKFIDSEKNEYVQYRFLGATTDGFTTVVNWQGVDSELVAGSRNLAESGEVLNELALGAVYDVSAKNPTAGPNNDGKFESLSALFSDTNINTLIPIAVRKGGMSIKFVQSSDNNYVQYRLMADSWSININDWSFYGDDILVEDDLYTYVILDAKKRVIVGINKGDGTLYFGAGIPPQIIKYITEEIDKIKNGTTDTSIDGINKIVSFLSDFSTSDTLKSLLDEKVDKVAGKSLIQEEVADNVKFVDDLEYTDVTIDKNNNILEGIKKGGRKKINIPIDTPAFSMESADSSEWGAVEIDKKGKILGGRNKKGILHEKVGFVSKEIYTDSLKLSSQGMEEFIQSLENAGLSSYIKMISLESLGEIWTNSDAGDSTIYHPSIIETYHENALGRYYMYYSYDHQYGRGENVGIKMAYSDDLVNWTLYGNVLKAKDQFGIETEQETETPAVIYNDGYYIMIWHSVYKYDGANYVQNSYISKSLDGINWEYVKVALRNPKSRYVGDLHDGYWNVIKENGLFVSSLLLGGTDYGYTDVAFSKDGYNWLLYPNNKSIRSIDNLNVMNISGSVAPVFIRGDYYRIGKYGKPASGSMAGRYNIGIQKLADDRITVLGNVAMLYPMTHEGESTDVRDTCIHVINDEYYITATCRHSGGKYNFLLYKIKY